MWKTQLCIAENDIIQCMLFEFEFEFDYKMFWNIINVVHADKHTLLIIKYVIGTLLMFDTQFEQVLASFHFT